MAIEHVLTDVDSVHTLAVHYFNDATRWTDIVDYNGLEYPYIVTDPDDINDLSASGYIQLTRDVAMSDLTVYAGSTLGTKVNNQGIQKIYAVTEDTVIKTGQTTGYVYVRCVVPGIFGNVIANDVTEIVSLQTSLGQYLGNVTITNLSPFDNGVDAKVLTTGQSIYIPITEDASITTVTNTDTFLNVLGGTDFSLDSDFCLTDDGFGDIGVVVGLDNITQAVKHRLMTEAGSLSQNPEYGTRVAELIGSAQLPYINRLIEFDIKEALSYEDRVTNVVINSLTTDGTSVWVDLTLEINKQGTTVNLQLDF
jgi:phage baseplate assembly protein W